MPTDRIVLADDDLAIFKTLSALLEREDYELHAAKDGVEALRLVKELRPDLLLLDLMMPGMNGIEVCKSIRQDPSMADLPIIVLTAYHDRATLVRALDVGADEFLAKPVMGVELRARVRTMLRIGHQKRRLETIILATGKLLQTSIDDLQMPLTDIMHVCQELSQSGDLTEVQRTNVSRIVANVQRLELIVKAIVADGWDRAS